MLPLEILTTMKKNRYTEQVHKAIHASKKAAVEFKHKHIGCGHLFLGVLDIPNTYARTALYDINIDPVVLRELVLQKLSSIDSAGTEKESPLSEDCKKALERSIVEAKMMSEKLVNTGHLVLGLFSIKESIPQSTLAQFNFQSHEYVKALKAVEMSNLEVRYKDL